MTKRITRLITFSVLGLSLGACATSKGFNRGDLQSQMGIEKPVYDDKEIEAAYDKKPNLPKPFKLAVYFRPSKQGYGPDSRWRWTEQDKQILDEAAQDLKKQGLVTDVFPLIGSLVKDDDIKSLRMAAAKHQADALLVISGAGDIDNYTNKAGYSYALLLPALFVPGSEADTLFVTSAAMWDVKNEYLYVTAETEALTKHTHVAAWGKRDEELLVDAKTKAVAKLRDEFKRMVTGTKL